MEKTLLEEYKLTVKHRLSFKATKEMIFTFAKYGNHNHNLKLKTNNDLKRLFKKNNQDYKKIIESCRNPLENVPFFENIMGSTWTYTDESSFVTLGVDGKEKYPAKGPGKYVSSTYWAIAEDAKYSRDRAISSSSSLDLHTAILKGISCIEAYINFKVEQWNSFNNDKLEDSKENKVSLDKKFKEWIPKMTQGKKLDLGNINWYHFLQLSEIRHNNAIHPKNSSYSISFETMANQLNILRTGVFGLLIDMHILFNNKIPAVIIRSRYFPDVEVRKNENI